MYKQKLFSAAAALMILTAAATAEAGIGTGIGISFPASGSHSSGPSDTYAAFSFDEIAEELTVSERHGKLRMELKVTNGSDQPYTVEHRSGQCFDFALLDKNGKTLYRWSDTMSFTQATASSTIPAHQSSVYTAEISARDYRKIKEDAVVVSAWLTDTPYVLSSRIPSSSESGRVPVVIHGGIILGNGNWDHDHISPF